MNAWEAIACDLKAEKTEYVFRLPGGDLFYGSLYDAPRPEAHPSNKALIGTSIPRHYATDFKIIFLGHVILYLLKNLFGFSVESNGCGLRPVWPTPRRVARLVLESA